MPPIVRALVALVVAIASIAAGYQVAIGAEDAKILGRTGDSPRPMCPAKDVEDPTIAQSCEVTGQVTGFQRSADGKKGLFKVKEDGKIVAWSVDLSDPRRSERETFGEASQTNRFGKAPTAGVSIIRATDGSNFRLKSASPIISVRGFYGEKPVITLDQPLRVRKGDVVALTTATWLPAFSRIRQKPSDTWVASRQKRDWADGSDCTFPDNVPPDERLEYFFDHSSPHRREGSERPYQCVYKKARILYWAYFVPNN